MKRRDISETPYKTAKTIKEYRVTFSGYELVVPVGSTVSNRTSLDNNDNYRFWEDFAEYAQQITTFRNSTLSWDLAHRGLNIPAEYCEPYDK